MAGVTTMIDFIRCAEVGRFAHILDVEAYCAPLDHHLTVADFQTLVSDEHDWDYLYLDFLPKHPLGTASNHYLTTLLFTRKFLDCDWVNRELAAMKPSVSVSASSSTPVITPPASSTKKTYAEALCGTRGKN